MILVSVWLTTPYFFLVSMGALQSIPAELTEAARVDGGGAWQIFRRVTLPLLLVAVAPLMIASFAFNFNNFNNVYLLTGGGPYTAVVGRGHDRHPDQLHVQARDRVRQGIGLRRSRARSRSSSSSSSRRSPASRSGGPSHWRTCDERSRPTRTDDPSRRLGDAPSRSAKRRAAAEAARTPGGATSSRRSPSSSRSSRSSTSSRRRSTATTRCSAREVIPTHVTLHNFSDLLHNNVLDTSGAKQDAPYLHWFLNSMIVARCDRDLRRRCSARSPPTRSAASASRAGAWGC